MTFPLKKNSDRFRQLDMCPLVRELYHIEFNRINNININYIIKQICVWVCLSFYPLAIGCGRATHLWQCWLFPHLIESRIPKVIVCRYTKIDFNGEFLRVCKISVFEKPLLRCCDLNLGLIKMLNVLLN